MPRRKIALTSTAAAALLALSLAVAPAPPAAAQDTAPERRIALIVGNGDYAQLEDLPNAPNDAALVTEYFQSLGYETVSLENADFAALSDALSEVAGRLDEGSTVVFYFAGHGLQVGAGNFLLPTDSRIDGLYDLHRAAMPLSHVMSLLSARAENALFILDSCRDNPFLNALVVDGLENTPKPVGTGFYFQRSPIDTFVAFSTSPGELAFDGPSGGNSPYTAAFVANARANPGAEINFLMARVRRDVHATTDGRQLPWESSSLTETLVLGGAGAQALVVPAPLAPGDQQTRTAALAAAPAETRKLTLAAGFDREVPFGTRLAAQLPAGSFTLLGAATGGDLAVIEEGRLRVLREGDAIPAELLPSLSYRPRIPRFTPITLESLTRGGVFRLADAASGQAFEVELSLPVHPCDLRAGGVLDPQGVGAEVHPHEMRPLAALAACREAVELDPGNARFRTQFARALIATGDLDAARQELVAAIEGGHIRATQRLGILEITAQAQRDGMLQQAAPPQALEYLEVAHRLGDPLADYTLGRELMRYGESDAARERGFALLSRAHSAGYIEALNELARYFLDDDSTHFDPERGLRYFESTAERGNINGQNSLGTIYRTGRGGVEVDFARAAREYEAAARGGHPVAPYRLGRMYEDGQGVPVDLARAIEWFDTGLERGDPWSGARAAQIILRQSPPGTTRFDAASRAGRAAALGDSRPARNAREYLGEMTGAELAGGAQALLNDLGADLTVDGNFGPASMAAFAESLGPRAEGLTPDQPLDLLLAVAAAHWEAFGFRVDLL